MNTPTPRLVLLVLLAFLTPASLCYAQGGRRNSGGGGGNRGEGGSQFDAGLKPINDPKWVFPYELAVAGTTGSAELSYFVDVEGKPIDIKVTSQTKKEFGLAAAALLEEVRFTPQLDEKTQKPKKSDKQTIEIPFSKERAEPELFAYIGQPENAPVAVTALDSKGLMPVGGLRPPTFPAKLAAKKVASGEARIEFLVDPNGVPHMPRIVSATEPEFGWAAATRVLEYRFSRPVKDGKPVVAKVTLPFKFTLPVEAKN